MNQALCSRINIALWAFLVAVTATGYALIPPGTLLPIHWGPNGQPDALWPRDTALLIAPVLALLVSAVLYLVGRFAPAAQIEASRHAWRTVIPALTALFLVIQGGITLIGLGYPDQMVRIICLALGMMLILFGNIMPKMQPNGLAGIRLPWLSEPHVWRATQRLGGMMFIIGGLILLAGALVVSNPVWLLVLLLVALAIPLVVTTIYSYRMAHSGRGYRP